MIECCVKGVGDARGRMECQSVRKDMYGGAGTQVRSSIGLTDKNLVGVRLHQGSSLRGHSSVT